MKNVSKTAVIFPGVKLGRECVIEDFAVIGAPPRGCREGEMETVIGHHAVIRSHTVIYAGNIIGHHFETGNKANVRERNTIGNHVCIGSLCVVEHHVKIENNVCLHTQVFVPEFCILEEACWLGPHVVLTNSKYPRSPRAKKELKGVRVMRKAVIGANSTLLPGIVIGAHAFVGAGSVVTEDVPPLAVVAGNPAKVIKNIRELPYKIKRSHYTEK